MAVTTTNTRNKKNVEAKNNGIEFYRQLNHFGQLIEHVARQQVAGDVDGARLALDMHHLAQLHQWLDQHHSEDQSDRHDFQSVTVAYEKICDFERVKLGL